MASRPPYEARPRMFRFLELVADPPPLTIIDVGAASMGEGLVIFGPGFSVRSPSETKILYRCAKHDVFQRQSCKNTVVSLHTGY